MPISKQSDASLANTDVDSNDIDLMKLFYSMLRVWKYWVLALIIVSCAFFAIKALQVAFHVNDVVYSKPIRLTFPKAQQLEFPSGAKFAYSDIVAPAVVQVAFERNNLKAYDLTVADLQNSLSAMPYAPTYPLIIIKYEKLMSDKKLTIEQLNNLQKRMEDEVNQATKGEAVITLRLDKKVLPQLVIDKFLNDIPAIWAERAMNEKGVLEVNAQLASINSLNADLIKKSEGLIAGDLLYEKLALLKENIKEMSKFEGVQSIKDPVTGMKLMDLSFAVDDLGRYVIGDLISPLRELGLSRDVKSTLYYYEDKVNKLKINLAALNRQANALKDVYDSYVQVDRKAPEQGKEGQISSPTVVPQLSADMLDKLVSFSGEAVRETYKQELNKKWFVLTKDVADAESTLANAQLVLSSVQKAVASGGKLSSGDEQYLIRIERDIPNILTKMASFFEVSDRIYRQLSIESVGVKDKLYIPVTNTVVINKTLFDIKSTLLVWIALLFLTTVIVVPVCMIRNAMIAKAQ